jgi:hypothetical protein
VQVWVGGRNGARDVLSRMQFQDIAAKENAMPTSKRALILLGAIFLGATAFDGTGAAAQGLGTPMRRAPVAVPDRRPIGVGPAPRSLPSSRLSCVTRQVRVCGLPPGCPKYQCHYTCRMETRCVSYRR